MNLIAGPTLTFSPLLAEKIGLNAAIILEKLHFELLHSPIQQDGFTWFIHTYDKWKKHFPFWSKDTIVRTFLKLEMEGFIISSDEYNATPFDRRKWYRINYEKLQSLYGNAFVQSTGEKQHYNVNYQHASLENPHMTNAKVPNANTESVNINTTNSQVTNSDSANINIENLQVTNSDSANTNTANLQVTNSNFADMDIAKLQVTNSESAKMNYVNSQMTNTDSSIMNNANLQVTNPQLNKRGDTNIQHPSTEITNTNIATYATASLQAFQQHSTAVQPSMLNTNNQNGNLPTNHIKELVINIIQYLNKQANKNFNPHLLMNTQYIYDRLNEGYTFEDFKYVIDLKVSQWLENDKMNPYLRPSTLFKLPNFENYLNEKMKTASSYPYQPIELDFEAGEEAPPYDWL